MGTHIHCSNCEAALEVPEQVRLFACAACGTPQRLVQEGGVAYAQIIEQDPESLARAHVAEALAQRRQNLINAMLELEENWKKQEASFMENGRLRVIDPNAQGANKVLIVFALGASIMAFFYWLNNRGLSNSDLILVASIAAAVVFWTLVVWQSFMNSEKVFAYREIKNQIDAQRLQLQTGIDQLNKQINNNKVQ